MSRYSETPGALIWKECSDNDSKTLFMNGVHAYICVNRSSFKAGWFDSAVLMKLMSFVEASHTGVTDAADLAAKADVDKNKWKVEQEHKKEVMKRKMEEAEYDKEFEKETKKQMLENDAIRTGQMASIASTMSSFAATLSDSNPSMAVGDKHNKIDAQFLQLRAQSDKQSGDIEKLRCQQEKESKKIQDQLAAIIQAVNK